MNHVAFAIFFTLWPAVAVYVFKHMFEDETSGGKAAATLVLFATWIAVSIIIW